MATFGTLVTRLQDHFSTSSGSAARHLRQLNEWHRRILGLPGCEKFRRSTIDVTVAAGEVYTRIPTTFVRYERVINVSNNLPLTEQSVGWYRSLPPNAYSTGSPFAYVPYGVSAVAAQPAAAGTKTYAISTSGSDVSQKVYIRVRLATGQEVTANATLNGLTGVQLGTWTNAVEILQVFLDTAAAGNILISDSAAGTIPYGYIYPPDLNANRPVIVLVPTPSSTTTIRVDGIRAMDTDLLTTDQPWIPEEWEYLLELGARVLEYEKEADDRRAAARAELEVELKRFKFLLGPGAADLPVPGRSQVDTGSNLGPWYPKGRW